MQRTKYSPGIDELTTSTDLLLLMIIMMRRRVAAHAFTADQFQETLPGRCTPRYVVRALRVLFFLPSDHRLPIEYSPLLVLAVLLTSAAQSGSGTAAVPLSPSAATSCDYDCNNKQTNRLISFLSFFSIVYSFTRIFS